MVIPAFSPANKAAAAIDYLVLDTQLTTELQQGWVEI